VLRHLLSVKIGHMEVHFSHMLYLTILDIFKIDILDLRSHADDIEMSFSQEQPRKHHSIKAPLQLGKSYHLSANMCLIVT